MSKNTINYNLPYLEMGDYLYESDEIQRFNGIDKNLQAITYINGNINNGNGVLSGCAVSTDETNKTVSVATGKVLINGVVCNSGVATITLVSGNTYTIYGTSYITPSISNYYMTATIKASIIPSSLSNTAVEIGKVYIY